MAILHHEFVRLALVILFVHNHLLHLYLYIFSIPTLGVLKLSDVCLFGRQEERWRSMTRVGEALVYFFTV